MQDACRGIPAAVLSVEILSTDTHSPACKAVRTSSSTIRYIHIVNIIVPVGVAAARAETRMTQKHTRTGFLFSQHAPAHGDAAPSHFAGDLGIVSLSWSSREHALAWADYAVGKYLTLYRYTPFMLLATVKRHTTLTIALT